MRGNVSVTPEEHRARSLDMDYRRALKFQREIDMWEPIGRAEPIARPKENSIDRLSAAYKAEGLNQSTEDGFKMPFWKWLVGFFFFVFAPCVLLGIVIGKNL